MISMSPPLYFNFFTQGENPYLDLSWVKSFDMSWVDRLNTKNKAEGDNDIASKDIDSCEFPHAIHWPKEFEEKFNHSVAVAKEKKQAQIEGAEETLEIDYLTIYLDCPDGHHYFKTSYYNNGSIERAVIRDDSPYDSAETAVYIFVNEWKDWDKEHGQKYRQACSLSSLEALRAPKAVPDASDGCEHGDLASLGHRHGDIVICPYCGNKAEVW